MGESWDYKTDVLVVGSGGGGMTAALMAKDQGNDVLCIEKGRAYGGSTAMSGGTVWIPNNHLMKRLGCQDSEEEAFQYLQSITEGRVREDRLWSYLASGPRMLEYLEKHSRVRFAIVRRMCDYYQNAKGAKPEGRSLEAVPISIRRLTKGFDQIQDHRISRQASLTVNEAVAMLDSSWWGRLGAIRIFARYYLDPTRCVGKGDSRLTLGNALVARLRLSLADRNIPVWLETPAHSLIVDAGRVAGLEALRSGRITRIGARKAVILAAGGFAHNQAMREQHQRGPVSTAWSAASRNDTGDAIRMASEIGAALDFMYDAWWASTSLVSGWSKPIVSIVERNLPGSIMVNKMGRRFTNEAAPYSDVVKAQYASHWQGHDAVPAYLIIDSRFRSRYLTGPMMPGKTPKMFIDRGYIRMSDTIEGLARQCGIDPVGLISEINAFNANAAKGKDQEFGRGDSLLDRFYGDPSVRPNSCLRPVDKPPFYAIEMWPGDIGTKGGLRTDAQARVLREDGAVIESLYAIGNCSSPVMGASYAGGGATISSSMVFGYIAALNAGKH